jgi:hypothetical protein
MTAQDTVTLTRSTVTASSEPPLELVVPRQLGSVQLTRELGRGGMGVVWLGHDDLLLRQVAVKFLTEGVAGPEDPGFVRFIEGARGAAAVRHPGLTTVYHADLVAGIPYLVMEYIGGPSLLDVLRCCGPFEPGGRARHPRDHRGCHRRIARPRRGDQDIKPGNILLNAVRAIACQAGCSLTRVLWRRRDLEW